MARNFSQILSNLQDDTIAVADTRPAALSNLSREERIELAAGWAQIPLDKRQRLLPMMDEAAEEDFHLDFTALFRVALDDADAEVRQLAVAGLWMDESITLIRPLLKRLTGDPSAAVRATAATQLARFVLKGELDEVPADRHTEMVQALIERAADTTEPSEVRARALESVSYVLDDRVPGLIQRAYNTRDDVLRRGAICAMGRHGEPQWLNIVRPHLFDEDPAYRFEATRAAGEMEDRGAAGRLVELTRDPDPEIREEAVVSLGGVGGKIARTALQKIAKGSDQSLREAAKEALIELTLLEDEDAGFLLFDVENNLLNGNPIPEDEDDLEDAEWDDEEWEEDDEEWEEVDWEDKDELDEDDEIIDDEEDDTGPPIL